MFTRVNIPNQNSTSMTGWLMSRSCQSCSCCLLDVLEIVIDSVMDPTFHMTISHNVHQFFNHVKERQKWQLSLCCCGGVCRYCCHCCCSGFKKRETATLLLFDSPNCSSGHVGAVSALYLLLPTSEVIDCSVNVPCPSVFVLRLHKGYALLEIV